MNLPDTRFSRPIDTFLHWIGAGISWLWVILMVIIVVNVFARYLFAEGRIEFEEIQWHLYSTGFMLALGYAMVTDSHIRVDVLHERFSPRIQAWIDLYGLILFVLPFAAMMIFYAIPFVAYSFETSEVSASPGGLPFRWAIKSVLLIGFVLLGLATLSRISRLTAFLKADAR